MGWAQNEIDWLLLKRGPYFQLLASKWHLIASKYPRFAVPWKWRFSAKPFYRNARLPMEKPKKIVKILISIRNRIIHEVCGHTCWPKLRSATTAQQSCRILQWLGLYLPLQYFCMIQLLGETQALTRIQRMEQNPIEKEPRGWLWSLHWHQSLFEWGQQRLWGSLSCRFG